MPRNIPIARSAAMPIARNARHAARPSERPAPSADAVRAAVLTNLEQEQRQRNADGSHCEGPSALTLALRRGLPAEKLAKFLASAHRKEQAEMQRLEDARRQARRAAPKKAAVLAARARAAAAAEVTEEEEARRLEANAAARRQAAAAEAMAERCEAVTEWECPACTLLNAPLLHACEVCETLRPFETPLSRGAQTTVLGLAQPTLGASASPVDVSEVAAETRADAERERRAAAAEARARTDRMAPIFDAPAPATAAGTAASVTSVPPRQSDEPSARPAHLVEAPTLTSTASAHGGALERDAPRDAAAAANGSELDRMVQYVRAIEEQRRQDDECREIEAGRRRMAAIRARLARSSEASTSSLPPIEAASRSRSRSESALFRWPPPTRAA